MGVEKSIDINSFPKQYTAAESKMGGIGRKVEVCFNYNASKTITGVIIRDDKGLPFQRSYVFRMAESFSVLNVSIGRFPIQTKK